MTDLTRPRSTSGLELRNTDRGLARTTDRRHRHGVRRLALDAGTSAIVLPSLFEEDVLDDETRLNLALEAGSEHFAEALTYFSAVDELLTAADRYCQTLSEIKQAVDVPVIASLNASSAGGWIHYASNSRPRAPTPSN